MINNIKMTLSEGITLLSRDNTCQGVLVHRECMGNYVTLRCSKARVIGGCIPNVDRNHIDDEVRISIGERDFVITMKIDDSITTILENCWVSQWEDIRINCSVVNAYCVYGIASKKII